MKTLLIISFALALVFTMLGFFPSKESSRSALAAPGPTAPSSSSATPVAAKPTGTSAAYVTATIANGKQDGGPVATSAAIATPVATAAVAAATTAESWDVRHTPSIDAAMIRQVLQKYNSPAIGASDAMYNLGVEYGIDPAFCLAFFINESTAGTAGVARTTKSVGNIRTTAGYADYQGYRKYDSWEQGIEDWYRLIRDLYIGQWNLTTVDQIIPVYAPTFDSNNPDHYVSTVKTLVSTWRAAR